MSAICPNCHILLVEASDDQGTGLYASVNAAASLGAKFIVAGWGSVEASSDGIDDTEYFNHPGVVITAGGNASGSVQYPASSPDVIAVGGITLKAAANTRGWTETAWADGNGACSGFENRTAWHTSTYCAGRRASNDVAADADPNTGVAAYDSYRGGGGWSETGGLSIASAIVAATYALAGTPAPGTNPASYLYAHTTSLFDVTSGGTSGCGQGALCLAGSGWDGPTGLGTPNGRHRLRVHFRQWRQPAASRADGEVRAGPSFP